MKKTGTMYVFRRVLSLLLAVMIASVTFRTEVKAASLVDSLGLKTDIKMNQKNTFHNTGLLSSDSTDRIIFTKAHKFDIATTVTTSKKTQGNYYVATFKVKYTFAKDVALDCTKEIYDDYLWSLTMPVPCYTVFDNETGLCLENDNDADVVVTAGSSKVTYYPKQTFYKYGGEKCWWKNYKTITTSFQVKYPRSYKNAVVAIGFVNINTTYVEDTDNTFGNYTNTQKFFDSSEISWKKCPYYKYGKKTFHYVKLG